MNNPDLAGSDSILRQLLEQALGEISAAEGSILLATADGKRLRFVVAKSPVADTLVGLEQAIENGIVGRSVSSQQPMIVNNAEQEDAFDPSVDAKTGVKTNSIMVVPLIHSGRAIGAVTAINSTAPGFSERDLESYRRGANLIAERLAQLDRS